MPEPMIDPATGKPVETPEIDPSTGLPKETQPPEPTEQEKFAKMLSNGINEGRQRSSREWESFLKGLGVKIEGNPQESLKKHMNDLVSRAGATTQNEQFYQTKIAEDSSKIEALEKTVVEKEIGYKVLHAVEKANVVDVEAVQSLFESKYKVEKDSDGYRIYKDGTVMYDTKTGRPATIEQALKEFLDDKKFLVKATSREGGSGAERMTGVKENDLMKEYTNPNTTSPRRREIEKQIGIASKTLGTR